MTDSCDDTVVVFVYHPPGMGIDQALSCIDYTEEWAEDATYVLEEDEWLTGSQLVYIGEPWLKLGTRMLEKWANRAPGGNRD